MKLEGKNLEKHTKIQKNKTNDNNNDNFYVFV